MRIFASGVDHPLLSIGLVLLALIASILVLPEAEIDPSPERVYPPDSPRAVFAAEHRERFGREDGVLFAVREGDPFDPAIEAVAAAMEANEAVDAVLSPARLEVLTLDAGGALTTRPLQPGEEHPLAAGTLLSLIHI